MAVWMIRAGSHGEYEQKFLQEGRVYVTWEKLAHNLDKLADLLFTFGAFLTICRVQRNNAEARIIAMRASGWRPATTAALIGTTPTDRIEIQGGADLEELARDQIAQLVSARLKGHGLARLVEAILKAQGYTTYRSPEGPDGGVDILAGAGPLGFGSPRLCVQVKSQDHPIEAKALNELRGAMQHVNASEGLFVSWSGFKSTVYRQAATSFFTVRMWTQKDLLEALYFPIMTNSMKT
jgi:restriction system protein